MIIYLCAFFLIHSTNTSIIKNLQVVCSNTVITYVLFTECKCREMNFIKLYVITTILAFDSRTILFYNQNLNKSGVLLINSASELRLKSTLIETKPAKY